MKMSGQCFVAANTDSRGRAVEFIVWYIKGFQAFDQFSKDRAAEDNGLIREDVYFKLVRNVYRNDDKVLSGAVFKKAVATVSSMTKEHSPELSSLTLSSAIQQPARTYKSYRTTCGRSGIYRTENAPYGPGEEGNVQRSRR